MHSVPIATNYIGTEDKIVAEMAVMENKGIGYLLFFPFFVSYSFHFNQT